MKRKSKSLPTRLTAWLLTLVCVLGLFPATASAAVWEPAPDPNVVKLERMGMSGVSYTSPALGTCTLHQMYYDVGGVSSVGFCAEKGRSMGNSLIGQTWGNRQAVSDPSVSLMMAYYYAHSTGTFTDKAVALGVNTVWDAGYTWYMNAWVQAIVWRYKEGKFSDPVVASAEELMAVYNVLEGTNYDDIDDKLNGSSFRDRTQYIFDLGAQGVWGDCDVYEYTFTGAGSSLHPANRVQAIMLGELSITEEQYALTVKKVDSTNPTKGLAGARFHIESTNGSFSKDVVSGSDGTVTLSPLDAGTYAVTETYAPDGYKITNAGPEYVVLPSNGNNSVTITFEDDPIVNAVGDIRKVDADDPTRGLAGAVIKIEGVDNNFAGTYTTVSGGALNGVPWSTMPIGSYTATEITAPEGYTISSDPDKVKQEFYWDGKNNVNLVFENDAKVKLQLIKKDDSNKPQSGAVFNIVKDGQVIGSEATDAAGKITITNVTEGMYAFVEVAAPSGYAKLQEPVIAHVDQKTVEGGGTVIVTASNKKLPELQILKKDEQTGEPVANTTFEIKGIHFGYHQDVTTNSQGIAILTGIPVDSYEVTEKAVPEPYVIAEEPAQTIFLAPGGEYQLVFENLKKPLMTIKKVEAGSEDTVIPGTVFTVEGIDNDYKEDWTTEEDGTVSKRILPGSYKITEKSVPAPYYLPDNDNDRVQTISLNAGDEKELVFVNHKMPELTIYKEDSVAGAPVEGAKFRITYTSNGESANAPATIDFGYIYTNAQGEIRLHEQGQRLYPGEYTVTEVEPAEGFQMKEPSTQKVILHGSESRTLTFQNEPLNAIIVEKYDSVTKEAVPGAKFVLRFLGGTSGTGGTIIGQKTTGKNGTAIWTGLTAGTYILEEVDPADGYSIIQSSETIYLADSGEQSVVTIRFENAPDGSLLIRKVCSVNPSITLQDAEFKVTYSDGQVIGDANGIYRTDENGEILIEGLKPGKSVIVTETKAPKGFIIDTQSQTIQVKEGRTVTLTFKNQPKGELIIQKRSTDGEPLAGAEFRVTTAAGCEVGLDGVIGDSTLTQNGIFTTDSNGEIHITNLIPGAYVITEIKAPDGYVITQPSTNVVIGENGDAQTVVIKNAKKGALVIVKKDDVTGKPLEGVQFKVTTSDGSAVSNAEGEVGSNGLFRTDAEGMITIYGLAPDTYIVRETDALPGYVLDDTPQTVKLDTDSTQTLTFTNKKAGVLVIHKLSTDKKTPLEGVVFKVTTSTGEYVPDEGGKLSSNGLYTTDENGLIQIDGVVGTLVVTEMETIPGYTIDENTRSQTVVVNPDDTQSLYFYNQPVGGVEIIKMDKNDNSIRIPGVRFEIRKMDDGLIDTITTDQNGRAFLSLEDGAYYAVEIKAADSYQIDSTPIHFEVKNGETTVLEVENQRMASIMIHKIDAATREGIYGVKFVLYDSGKNPIGEYTTDQDGYIYIDDELTPGKYFLRELEAAEGYIRDEQYKTVYVEAGKCAQIKWENSAVTGQIQVRKYALEDNPVTGQRAGEPLEGAVFEITRARSGSVVGHIVTDARGIAASGPLPLGRYYVTEVSAPAYFQVSGEKMEAEIEYVGQIVKLSAYNKAANLGVTIKKTGNYEVQPGQVMYYNFSGIGNGSNVALNNFYWHDRIPTDATRGISITTGTYNQRLYYKVTFKTNVNDYRTLASNLLTTNNYSLSLNATTLGLVQGEYVTDVRFEFGTVPSGFESVVKPTMRVQVLGTVSNGYQIINRADVGGQYLNEWQTARANWVTTVFRFQNNYLPKTGY